MRTLVLNENGLKDKKTWEEAGYALPKFDREKVKEETKKNPAWIHFGAGNIFRAFQANACQKMLDNGDMTTGLVVAEGFDYEIIEKSYRPQDNYSILVTLKADRRQAIPFNGFLLIGYIQTRTEGFKHL